MRLARLRKTAFFGWSRLRAMASMRSRFLGGLGGLGAAVALGLLAPPVFLLPGEHVVISRALDGREDTVDAPARVVEHGLHARPRLLADGAHRLELVPRDAVHRRGLGGSEIQGFREPGAGALRHSSGLEPFLCLLHSSRRQLHSRNEPRPALAFAASELAEQRRSREPAHDERDRDHDRRRCTRTDPPPRLPRSARAGRIVHLPLLPADSARNAAAGTGIRVAITDRGAAAPVRTDSNAARAESALPDATADGETAGSASFARPLPDRR